MSRFSKFRKVLQPWTGSVSPQPPRFGGGKSTADAAREFITVEPLESRMMLAAYVIDSVGDDLSGVANGQLTLREAIIAAETNAAFGDAAAGDLNGDTISFDVSLLNQTITLSEGDFAISDDLVIDGGTRNVRLLGQLTDRIFTIDTTEDVSISGLRVQNGFAVGDGGAAWLSGVGSVTFDSMTFTSNASDGNGGGAIFTQVATLTVNDSTFGSNDANGPSGSGGAIYIADGSVSIATSTFNTNEANRGGGGINIEAGTLDLVGTDFTGNVAGPTGSASPGNGGALRVGGIGVTVIVSGGTVQSNQAAQEGGGFWNQAGSSLTVQSAANFVSNQAKGNAADDGGGALFNNGGTLTVLNSTFTNNRASGSAGSGGAIFTAGGLLDVRNSALKTNDAIRAGGAIEVFGGTAELRGVTLGGPLVPDKNTAGRNGTGNPGNGAGLHISGGIGTTVLVSGGLIQNNEAFNSGGGIWNSGAAELTIENGTQIINNFALGASSTSGGGGIFSDGGTLTIRDAFIGDNQSTGAAARGGGIFSTGGNLTISGSTISGNQAQRSGGGIEVTIGNVLITGSSINSNEAGYNFGANPGNGGGIHAEGIARIEIRSSAVSNNTADKSGGGIWNANGGTVIVRSSTVGSNTARGSVFGDGGGGIYSVGGVVRLISSAVVSNTANGLQARGGGLLVQSGTLNARDGSQIAGNSAVLSGGGVEFVNGYTRMDDSIIGGAQASDGNSLTSGSGTGAGFQNSGNNPSNFVLFNNMTVQNNVAPQSGGGLWLQSGSTLSVRGSTVFGDNQAQGGSAGMGGGAIFNNGGNVRLFGTTVVNNSATGALGGGGGVFVQGGVLNTREGTAFRGNEASQWGGAIEVANGYVSLTDSTIGGDPLVDVNKARFGGGLHVTGTANTTVILDNSTVRYNEATVAGGGLWNQSNAYMLLRNGTVVSFNISKGNGTLQGGAGVFNQTGGLLEVHGSRITDNISDGNIGNGGGIFNAVNSHTTLVGATISSNSTRGNGGGVYNAGTLVGDALSTVFANLALDDGGGVFVALTGINGLNGTVVSSNSPNNIVFE